MHTYINKYMYAYTFIQLYINIYKYIILYERIYKVCLKSILPYCCFMIPHENASEA